MPNYILEESLLFRQIYAQVVNIFLLILEVHFTPDKVQIFYCILFNVIKCMKSLLGPTVTLPG